MKFRADEEIETGRLRAVSYLTKHLAPAERAAAEEAVDELIAAHGPVVESYPSWHPLVSRGPGCRTSPPTRPGEPSGYKGLDHSIYFRNAFVTCPYTDGSAVLKSVAKLKRHFAADITAEALEIPLYNAGVSPVLVKCEWSGGAASDAFIPLCIAAPLMLEQELPCWEWAELAETWETMRGYILGWPHGSRSSLFVDQETGAALKSLYNALVATGMFGGRNA